MTNVRDVYKCNICGNVVELVHEGEEALVCCGQPMEKLEVKAQEEGKEKHVPVVEAAEKCECGCDDCGVTVKVGSVEHPMEKKHYIKFIEILTKEKVQKAELKPGMRPEASFCVIKGDIVEVREYCTVHGLWKA